MKYTADQKKFEEIFKTEQDCIDCIESIGWSNGFECPQCCSIRFWNKNKTRYECSDCGKKTRETNNTMFHKSSNFLFIWFHAIWRMVGKKNGVRAKGLQKVLGLGSYQTEWTWQQKFRRLMLLSDRSKFEGVVEVDEVFLNGKTLDERGQGAEGKSLFAIAVEVKSRKTFRVRLKKVSDASVNYLEIFIDRNIKLSSVIIPDGLLSYSELEESDYIHRIQKSTVKEEDEKILPSVHRVTSLLKRWLLGTHQSYLNKNKVDYYLDEYVFRYNRRKSCSRGLLFMRLLEQAVISEPVTFDKIINENHG